MTHRQQRAAQPETFMRGALMITLASFVSRFLGALYKPIVARLFAPFDGRGGDAGLGLVQVPQPAYQIILAISATGLNIVISKLVAERMATGQYENARRIFKTSMALMVGLGLLLGGGFYIIADFLAEKAGRPETAAGFKAIAPAIVLVSVMAALRGLFQGLQQMTAYAMSQIYEQVVRIIAGIVLVWLLAPRGVALGAAGYNLGAVAGAVFGLVYLLWLYWRRRNRLFVTDTGAELASGDQPGDAGESTWSMAGRILILAAPISVIGAVQQIIQMVDSMLVINQLEKVGILGDLADAYLGQLANAFSIIWLPSMLTHALYISLVPGITESLARGNGAQARNRSATAFRMTLLFGLPATVGLWLVPDAVYKLLFPGDGGPVLQVLSLATLPMMLQQTTSGILQGAGDIASPIRNFVVGAIAKVVLTWWWTASALGARGAAYATAIAFTVAAGLNLWTLARRWGMLVTWRDLRSITGATALMGLVVWLVEARFESLVGSVRIGGLLTMALAAVVFAVSLLALGGVRRQDIELVPKMGERLSALLRRLHLLRD